MARWRMFLAVAAALSAAGGAPGQTRNWGEGELGFRFKGAAEHFELRLIPSYNQVTAGQTFYVAAEMAIEKGWHYYSPDPGEGPQPGKMEVDAGKLRAGEVLWPADRAQWDPVTRLTNNAYEGRAVAYVGLTVPPGTPAGRYVIKVVAAGQLCQNLCLELRAPATTEVTVGPRQAPNDRWTGDLQAGIAGAMTVPQLKASHLKAAAAPASAAPPVEQFTVWAGLGLALLAGLILNIMPCVLPVIPLKVLGLVRQAKESRRRFVLLGLSFVGGIMLFFAGLATVNAVLKAVLQSAFNWGEHFQSRPFIIGMALLVVAVAANLFGLFTVLVPRRAWEAGDRLAGPGESLLSSFGMGVLTAILSTPCSFGILTAAFVWAQSQALWLGTIAIVVIGVGMAAPYGLLTAFPGLVKRLPRPGRWMELFKVSMGFVMLIVAIWLVSVLGAGSAYPFWVAAYAVVLAYCLWMWGSWARYDAPLGRKMVVRGLAVVLAAAAGFWMLQKPKPLAVDFQEFGAAQIAQARQAGRIVLVDFTARWCLTCKTVEALVYDDPEVAKALRQDNVLAVKGDVTTADLPANGMLYDELKEPGVPVTVIFPPGAGPPIRLHGLFNKRDLFQAMDEAKRQ